MRLTVERKPAKVLPDTRRVIARFFFNGEERAVELIKKILRGLKTILFITVLLILNFLFLLFQQKEMKIN